MTLTTENGLDGQYAHSPLERIRKHVGDFQASGGAEGARWKGGRW